LLKGEFTDHIAAIVEQIKSRGRAPRAIFVLDQFGYLDAPLPEVNLILRELKNAEVILTFATDSLIDYLSDNEQTQRIIAKLGISLPPKDVITAKQGIDWRRNIQLLLHRQLFEQSGAKYYTPFFIRSSDSHRDFWLIHLSGHHRARDVMVQLHWDQSTCFAHYGGSGLRMLGYDPESDVNLTKQKWLPGYYFDETARASSHEELREQLPKEVFPFKDGIVFDSLFSQLTNDAPVTSEIMKEALNELAAEGVVRILDKSGSARRRPRIQHKSDIILPSSQTRLIFRH